VFGLADKAFLSAKIEFCTDLGKERRKREHKQGIYIYSKFFDIQSSTLSFCAILFTLLEKGGSKYGFVHFLDGEEPEVAEARPLPWSSRLELGNLENSQGC